MYIVQFDEFQTPINKDGSVDYESFMSIICKVATSFFYFVCTFCWIENKSSSGERIGETLFNLWPAQRPLPGLFIKHRLLAILKARQLGLTWLTAAYCLWKCITKQSGGFLCVVISANQDWAVEFLDRVRFMYNRLPPFLQPPLAKDGSEQMRFVFEWDDKGKKPLVFNDIKSLTTTPAGAQSKTPDLLVMDETARNPYAREIYGASKPGIDKAGGQIIVISNSHKRAPGWPWTRKICAGALRKENRFYFLFMPWWDCPERLTEEEAKKLAEDPTFVPQEYKRRQLEDGVDPIDISENLPNDPHEALSTVHGSYFGDTLSRHSPYLVEGEKGTIYRDRKTRELFFEPKGDKWTGKGPFVFELWRYPYFLLDGWNGQYWADRYAIGSDVSEGQGRSYSVAYVLDRYYDELVCKIRANRIDAVDWAKFLHYASLYYPNFYVAGTTIEGITVKKIPALVCVEKTGAGLTTVKELEKVGANQFIFTVHGKRGESATDDIGWSETRQSKHILCGDLRQWYRTCRGHVYCTTLLDESAVTIEHESGSIGPEKGELWDSVVAAGCAVQAGIQMGGPAQELRASDFINVNRKGGNDSNWGL